MPNSENSECDICKREVTDNDEGLLCDKCYRWKHRTCLAMSSKTYQKIGKMTDKWYCNGCATKPQKLVTNNDIMDKLESMERRYNDLLNKYNEQIQINNQLKTEIIEIKSQLNKSEQKELKNNVIVLGIPYRSNENLQQVVEKMGRNCRLICQNKDSQPQEWAKKKTIKRVH